VELGLEGPADKVSRRQAYLSLSPEGGFIVTNAGEQNAAVGTGMRGAPVVDLQGCGCGNSYNGYGSGSRQVEIEEGRLPAVL
jgi:hypothetical protein